MIRAIIVTWHSFHLLAFFTTRHANSVCRPKTERNGYRNSNKVTENSAQHPLILAWEAQQFNQWRIYAQ